MKNWLQDKTIVLTGASGGIGRQLCKLLVQKYGATVIGIGRSEEKMQSLCQELSAFENKFSYYLFDVSQRENWQNFKEELLQK
jgi:NADP-dependent 3-hydroxy acid dehydrogenase YdfG